MIDALSERRLTKAAREALESGDDLARLQLIRRPPPFVRHAAASAALQRLQDALDDYPTEGDTHILLFGPSGIGKSRLVRRFADQHNGIDDPEAPMASAPVLYVSMSGTASARGLLGRIMERLNAPYSVSASTESLYPLVCRLLRQLGVKILIIDEIHHIVRGRRDQRLEALAIIKLLGNDLNFTIVGCGIVEALLAFQYDSQLERRFEPVELSLWGHSEEAYGLLNSLETWLPLAHASNLSDPKLATWIIDESEGATREIVYLLKRAAKEAVLSGRERIDLPLLKSLGWTRPSVRRARASRMLQAFRQEALR